MKKNKPETGLWKKFMCVMLSVIFVFSIVPVFSYADEQEDSVAPTADVKRSTSDWTKDSVFLSIENAHDNENGVGLHSQPYSFSTDSGVYNWSDSADFPVTSNGSYYVSVRDINENINTYQIAVTNIDKTAPSIAEGSVEAERDDNNRSTAVTVPEVEDTESGLNERAYSFSIYPNVYDWTDENEKVFYNYTGKIFVYARDAVNNIALLDTVEVAEYSDRSDEVQRNETLASDEENPTPMNTTDNSEIVSFDTDKWTKKAILRINPDAQALQGKTQGEYFAVVYGDKSTSYTGSYENYFEIKINGHADIYLDGNREEIIATAEINNVDTDAPVINNIELNSENGYTTLSVDAYDEQSGICEYSFDNGETWQKSNTIVFKDNSKNYLDIIVKDFVGRTTKYNYYVNVPKYYIEDNKVVLYSENTELNDKIYYAEGESGDFREYKTPITVSDSTSLYVTFGENKNKLRSNSKRYTVKKNRELPVYYNEALEDAVIKYKNLQFKINRIYSSEDNNWFFSINSKLQYNSNDDIIDAKLFDGNETVYYPSSDGIYVNAYDSSKIVVTKGASGSIIKYTLVKNGIMYHFDSNGRISYISNRYEDRLSFKWSDNQLLIEDDKGRRNIISLDSQGNILSVTDLAGNTINYLYSGGRIASVKDQTDTVIAYYEYDDDGAIAKSGDKSIKYNDKGYLSEFEYDNGAYVKFSYRFEIGETYVYFELSNLKSGYLVYDIYGNLIKYSYDDEECEYGFTVFNALGAVTENGTKTYYYCDKDVVRSKKTDDAHIYYDYDEDANVVLEAKYIGTGIGFPAKYRDTDEFETQNKYEYDNGLLSKSIDCINNTETSYLYDEVGNIIKTTTVEKKARSQSITSVNFEYDTVGNIVNQYSNGLESEYTYDAAGRLLLKKINDKYYRTVYDDKGRIVQEISDEDYDSSKDGLPESTSYSDSSAGHTYTYNTVGDLVRENNELGIKTEYEYSKGVKVKEEFDIYRYIYNQSENLTDVYVSNSLYAHYEYDEKNNLTAINYGNGQKEIYVYDSYNHLISKSLKIADNDPELQFEYEYYTDYTLKIDYVNSQTVWYYDDETVITTLKYNSFNNIIKGDVIYRTKASVPTGDEDSESTINCSFLNDLSQLKITAGKDTYKTEFQGTEYTFESSYDENENVQNKAIKNAAESIVDYEYKYDSSGRVESYSVNTANFSNEYGYEYDDKGNITSYGSWVNGKVNPQECTTYHYDSKSQLVRVDENRHRSNGTRITDGTQVIEYDSRGNLKAVKNYSYSTDDTLKNNNPNENLELEYSYEDNVWLDEIEYSKGSEKQYVYDENGNPISIEDLNFHWTNGRQLESLSYMDENGEEQTLVSYKYDDNGIRVSKTIGDETTYYVYANGNILAQYKLDENNSPMEFMEFLYDDTGSITGFSYEGKTYFYVKNPQGDVTNIVDSNGVNLVNYYYYSYGESAFDIDESAYDYGYTRDDMDTVLSNPITYRGYYRDEETAFYYLQSRYYIPSGGRFLNADIPLYAQSQKDEFAGINLFVYCRNNPVNFSDPTGFKYVSEAGKAVVQIIVSLIELTSLENFLNKIPKPQKKKTTSKKSSKNHYSLSDFSIEGSLIFITAWNVLWDNIQNYFPNSSSADFISTSKLAFKELDDFIMGWGIIGAFIQLSEYQDNPYKDWSKKENTIYSITSLCLNLIAVFIPNIAVSLILPKIGDIISKVIILDKKHKVTL